MMRLSLHKGFTSAIWRRGMVVFVPFSPDDSMAIGVTMPRFSMSEKVMSLSSFTTTGSS